MATINTNLTSRIDEACKALEIPTTDPLVLQLKEKICRASGKESYFQADLQEGTKTHYAYFIPANNEDSGEVFSLITTTSKTTWEKIASLSAVFFSTLVLTALIANPALATLTLVSQRANSLFLPMNLGLLLTSAMITGRLAPVVTTKAEKTAQYRREGCSNMTTKAGKYGVTVAMNGVKIPFTAKP